MANHMAQVAKMLGVELGERFKVDSFEGDCFFTNDGFKSEYDDFASPVVLYDLLSGSCNIKKKPWKPSIDDTFWLVDQNGDLISSKWRKYTEQLNLYKLGNCYRTYEEAEANRDKWVAFYVSDKVLEV